MSLTSRDKKTIWHPYTQHKLFTESTGIVKGKGAYLFDENGKKYIDAISSWWTCLHGHSHPYIVKKISFQLSKLEHVIFAGFTHEPAVELAERLLKKLPANQKRIFFSDNGSTAVEVALKMSFQYWYNKGIPKTKVIAFRNSYHGDTLGAMSVSERGAFTKPFHSDLFETIFIDAPIKGNEQKSIDELKSQISQHKAAEPVILQTNLPAQSYGARHSADESQISSFIFEPIVQGVAGMVIHDSEALSEMISICKENNILTIADEVFTGFGRTGKFFATDYLSAPPNNKGRGKPDIFCLSKGLTGGTMAMGITSCTEEIFNAFLSEDRMKTFFHGHSFTANPVACSASLASLDLMEKKATWKNIRRIEKRHKSFAKKIQEHKAIRDVRGIGVILAIELKSEKETSYFNSTGDRANNFFLKKGILLRPLGNVIYLVPPYCVSDKDLDYIYDSIQEFIGELKKN